MPIERGGDGHPIRPSRAIEPPASPWIFPTAGEIAARSGPGEVVAVGADLEPGTVLAAYRAGLFPMPVGRATMGWWSPDPRGILPLDQLKVSRSLRKSCARFELRVDTAFADVVDACADKRRPGSWITREIRHAYTRLHESGWVHSVEAWDSDGRLAGGLYGVAIGGLFAGESMFHRQRDASKAALVGLVALLREGGSTLLDVQWATDHLQSLGVTTVTRPRYLELLADAVGRPQCPAFGGS